MRQLVIGDIHGAFIALQEVLIKSNFNYIEDQLIFLGDYVDGWSQSSEVIEFLIQLQDQCKIKPVFLRGNHDYWCEQWLMYGDTNKIWREQGGEATMLSYVKTGHLVDDRHKKFFNGMHNYYIDNNNRGFVHGGFNSRKGLGNENYPSDYYWDRDLWSLALMSHNRLNDPENEYEGTYFRRFEKHKELFIGHTATTNWRYKLHYPEQLPHKEVGKKITIPMHRCNVWNIDTGAGWDGVLTIMDVESKEYWQSTPVAELYPTELGRR